MSFSNYLIARKMLVFGRRAEGIVFPSMTRSRWVIFRQVFVFSIKLNAKLFDRNFKFINNFTQTRSTVASPFASSTRAEVPTKPYITTFSQCIIRVCVPTSLKNLLLVHTCHCSPSYASLMGRYQNPINVTKSFCYTRITRARRFGWSLTNCFRNLSILSTILTWQFC